MADYTADELVAPYVTSLYVAEFEGGRNGHLKNCPERVIEDIDGSDGSYGCDTGCEYLRFEATFKCPHGQTEDYEWGEFGMIHDLIRDLEGEDGRA